jgi:hypothetical protein
VRPEGRGPSFSIPLCGLADVTPFVDSTAVGGWSPARPDEAFQFHVPESDRVLNRPLGSLPLACIADEELPWRLNMMNHRVSAIFRFGRRRPLLEFLTATLIISASGRIVMGQENGPGATDLRAARGAEMKMIAESLQVSRGDGSENRPVALHGEPLLRWNDPTRNFSDASLWAWRDSGRPLAVVALELYPHSEANTGGLSWAFEFISLASEPLEVDGGSGSNAAQATKFNQLLNGSLHWAPAKPGITFREIPGAPPAASTPQQRLVQIKELSKRFASVEHVSSQPTLLRLMPHPLDRYADATKGQVDGAIFVLATGTNPEVMLLIEAQGPSADKATWRFAVAPVTAASYEVTFDRREVWAQPYASGQKDPNENYFVVRLFRNESLR